jgi:K(+)-stimulated pyrophosphate-energized sodium pump
MAIRIKSRQNESVGQCSGASRSSVRSPRRSATVRWRTSHATTVMLSFGMGASTQALFARVGGGIYTKAADVGADLVGKVEAGIPEDDPRNPATIADNVGDNVGDVAGMGADLYESTTARSSPTMAAGAARRVFRWTRRPARNAARVAPLALAGLGILCSIIGVFLVKDQGGRELQRQLLKGLHKGVYVARA